MGDDLNKLHESAIATLDAYAKEPKDETLASVKDAFGKTKEAFESELKVAREPKKAPEKYELKLKEGSKFDAGHIEKTAEFAKTRGFSQEHAQALIERDEEQAVFFQENQKKEYEKLKEGWLGTISKDKDLGGDNLKKNNELATRVLERFAKTPEVRDKIISSGLLMEPDVFRLVVDIGRAMSEDQLLIPGSKETPQKKSAAEILYGGQQ